MTRTLEQAARAADTAKPIHPANPDIGGKEGPNEPGNLRAAILDAARTLFADQGYDKVSMRQIAKLIGYSPTTIYLHFKNKSEIFFRITEEIRKGYLDTLTAIRKRTADPVETLEHLLNSYVDTGVTNPNAYKIGFMLESGIWTAPNADMAEGTTSKKLHTAFSDVVRACIAKLNPGKRTVDQDEVDLAIQTIWSMFHGLTSLLVTYPSYPWNSVERLKKRIVSAALSSLA